MFASSICGEECKTRALEDVRITKIPIAVQCWTFRKFSFLETLDKVKALGLHHLEAYPGQKLLPDKNDNSQFI